MISSGELQLLLLLFMLVILALLQNPLTCYVCLVLLPLSNTPFHQGTLICLLWLWWWWYLNSTSLETLVVAASAKHKW